MNVLKVWWTRHKLKTLGFLAMIFATAYANVSQIQSVIPPNRYGVVLFVFGLLAAIFGFLNSNP